MSGAMGPEVLGPIVDRHADALTLYARQWCDCPEDVVQEALIELARQLEAPRDPAAWLYRVVRNRAISASRSARRRRRHETDAGQARPGWFVPTGSELIDARAATAALESLPEDQREVVVAHIWGGLTFAQIGQVTGMSDSTAHRHYVAALSALRERLGSICLKND